MNTDLIADFRDPRASKLLLRDETEQIISCAFSVLNEVGPGFNEKLYENALTVEFKLRKIAFDQQRRFGVHYKDQLIGEFVPYLIAFNTVIVDTKVIEKITDVERGQMLNYLRITKLRVGLVLNFKHARLTFERIVF